MLAYGTIEVWVGNLSYDNPAKRPYCAAWLCPEEFWDNRTFTLLQQSAAGNAMQLLPDFRRALVEDPASAYAWANLAEVERDAGQNTQAKYCFQKAVAAGPQNPAILFRAANFAFTFGDKNEVLRDLSTVLKNPDLTGYYQAAFLSYSRLDMPVEEMLDRGIPANSTAAEPFLKFWMDENKVPEVRATWQWMLKHNLVTEKSGGLYTNFLLDHHDTQAALDEWKRSNPKANSSYQVLNWAFNGDFETEPRLGPFDWHLESSQDVDVARVQDTSRDGQWSVKLSFDGQANVEYHGVYQDAVLTPGEWQIRAYMKLDNITTDQGIALRVYDLDQPSRLDVRTDAQIGTMPWTLMERPFTVGPETKLVRIEVMRGASHKFDSKIQGRAWIDSVSLSPVR